MTTAEFHTEGRRITGFTVRGHSGYAPEGEDIVCAAVSSAVQLTANGITEVLHCPAEVSVEENAVTLRTSGQPSRETEAFLDAFRLHMEVLAEEYPSFIQLRYMEV